MQQQKLLANQQEDGDSPIKSIATGLNQRSRMGLLDGLRSFTGVDNRSAVDVGGWRRGTRMLPVKKPQFSEDFPDAIMREGADELTLRTDEVGARTQPTLSSRHGDRRLLMRTGMPFVRLFTKELKEKNGKSCTITTKLCIRRQGRKSLVTVKRQSPLDNEGTETLNFTTSSEERHSRKTSNPMAIVGRTP